MKLFDIIPKMNQPPSKQSHNNGKQQDVDRPDSPYLYN